MAKASQVYEHAVFGKLTVLEVSDLHSHGHKLWRCRCTCGKEVLVHHSSLTSGDVQSCGERSNKYHLGERFWANVNVGTEDECWTWTGQSGAGGYGVMKMNGKAVKAHRVSYLLSHDELPHDLDVLHSCDNPSCVNPKHLRLGTHTDNMRDRAQRTPHTWLTRGSDGRFLKKEQ